MSNEIEFDSDNLYYIKVSQSLVEDYLIMMNNPNINKYLSFKNRVFTYGNELKWIDEKHKNNDIVFSIMEKGSNSFVGNIEVMEIKDNVAEIGVVITENMQDKHYGSESIKRFVDYCLNELKFDNIELSVYSHNLKAIHCYEKLGFVEYKRDKNVGMYDNISIDDIYMKYMGKGVDLNE